MGGIASKLNIFLLKKNSNVLMQTNKIEENLIKMTPKPLKSSSGPRIVGSKSKSALLLNLFLLKFDDVDIYNCLASKSKYLKSSKNESKEGK